MECPIFSGLQRVLRRFLLRQKEKRRILSLSRGQQRPRRFLLRLILRFAWLFSFYYCVFCCCCYLNVWGWEPANRSPSYLRPFGLPPGAISLPFGRGGYLYFYINSVAVVFSMFGSRCYLIFSNANVATARIRPTSQKRVTIFASGTGCDGHLIFAGMSIFW